MRGMTHAGAWFAGGLAVLLMGVVAWSMLHRQPGAQAAATHMPTPPSPRHAALSAHAVAALPMSTASLARMAEEANAELVQLNIAAQAGDRLAQRTLAERYEHCTFVNLARADYLRGVEHLADGAFDPTAGPAIIDAGHRIFARCGGKEGLHYPLTATRTLRRQAAAQGDLASQAWLHMSTQAPLDKANYLELIEQSIAADDLDALNYLGQMAYRYDDGSQPVSGELAGYALQIAACRRGADCVAGGPLMDQFCQMGSCGSGDYEQLVRNELLQSGQLAGLDAAIERLTPLFPAPAATRR